MGELFKEYVLTVDKGNPGGENIPPRGGSGCSSRGGSSDTSEGTSNEYGNNEEGLGEHFKRLERIERVIR